MLASIVLLAVLLAPPTFNGLPAAKLHPCPDGSAFECGSLLRPLDPTGTIPGNVRIHFEWLAHRDTDKVGLGVIVANEGGPGSGSSETRTAYEALFHPILDVVDLLLVDNRGTDKSAAIDCEPLQSEPTMTYPSIAKCGRQLGQEAALYSTALAADDLAAVMDALQVPQADMYGDSYGTFFTQTFAARHPTRLRSLVLDGAYPVVGDSPWYPAAAQVMRTAYDAVCRRSARCATLPGTSMARIGKLVAALRASPLHAKVDVRGSARDVTVDPSSLATVMAATGLGTVPYRELDAAARALLDDGDGLPVERLVAESFAANEDAGTAQAYSRGLYTAVSCADYPQIYDLRLDPDARRAQRADAVASEKRTSPDVYAPFTIDEWLGMAPDYSVVDLCLDWPAPPKLYPPGPPIPLPARFPDVPTLVLSGELDTVTTPVEGAAVVKLFPHAQQVVLANSAHVDALDDPYACASRIAVTFIATLAPGDTACAAKIPPLRLVPAFARHASALAPATPDRGDHASAAQLRVVAAAIQAVGDAFARESWLPSPEGAGLRGGTFRVSTFGDNAHYQFYRARFTEDVAISGEVLQHAAAGDVSGSIAVTGVSRGKLDFQWSGRDAGAQVSIVGALDGRAVNATMPPP